ncbi:MAG: T9SS type A sorting domain-containing protein [Ignavibacteriales bacterium]|nr:T9SS type A sorting domain-containing protein [Ignavibacteriales bacterium]
MDIHWGPGSNVGSLLVIGTDLYAGCYDLWGSTGGVYRTTNLGTTWIKLTSSDTFNFVTSIAEMGGSIYVSTQGSGVFRSTNLGLSWSISDSGLPPPTGFFSDYTYTIIVNDTNLLAGTVCRGAFLSNNGGASWFQRGLNGFCILKFAFDNNTIYAGESGSGVLVSTNYGVNWTLRDNGFPGGVLSMIFHQGNIFAGSFIGNGTNNGVYRSSNQGQNWVRASTGLPSNVEVHSFAVIENILLAGTYGYGIFKSTDNGGSWFFISDGIPTNLSVRCFATISDKIFVGTSSNGVWMSNLSAILSIKNEGTRSFYSFSLSQNYPNPFNPSTTIRFTLRESQITSLKIYDIFGKEVATLIHNKLMNEGTHEIEFDATNLPSGMYFYRLQTKDFSETKKLLLLK